MIRIEKFKKTQSLNRGSQEIKLTVPLNTPFRKRIAVILKSDSGKGHMKCLYSLY